MSHLTALVAAPVVALGLISSATRAAVIDVTITGTVDYSIIEGNQASVADGAPVVMSFNLDPTVYQDSARFHTRAYSVVMDSFSLTVGGQPITVAADQPADLPNCFVLRDNDPVADGFVLSNNTDLPMWMGVNIPGLDPVHELEFLATYGSATQLSSLDILAAVGTHELNGVTAYQWTVGRFGNPGAEYRYDRIAISAVPGPAAAATSTVAAATGPRHRRRG